MFDNNDTDTGATDVDELTEFTIDVLLVVVVIVAVVEVVVVEDGNAIVVDDDDDSFNKSTRAPTNRIHPKIADFSKRKNNNKKKTLRDSPFARAEGAGDANHINKPPLSSNQHRGAESTLLDVVNVDVDVVDVVAVVDAIALDGDASGFVGTYVDDTIRPHPPNRDFYFLHKNNKIIKNLA